MKLRAKRCAALLLCVMTVCCLALPCAAEPQPTYTFEQVSLRAQVLENGSVEVQQTLRVQYNGVCPGFSWQVPGGDIGFAAEIQNLQAGGDLPTMTTQNGNMASVSFGSAPEGTYAVAITYRIMRGEDYDATADFLYLPLLGYGLDTAVRQFDAQVQFADGVTVQEYAVVPDSASAAQVEGFISTYDAGTIAVTASNVAPGTRALLQTTLPQGAFDYPPIEQNYIVQENVCTVDVSNDMVYNVHHRVTLDAKTTQSGIALPVLAFADASMRYTAEIVSQSGPVEMTVRRYDGRTTLVAALRNDTEGAVTVEYDYTLRPALIHAPMDLRVEIPYWAENLPTFSLTLHAPGLGMPQVLFQAVLAAPTEQRYTLSTEQNGFSFALTGPMVRKEAVTLRLPYDAAQYQRGATPQAVMLVVLAFAVLVLVCVVRIWNDRRRMLHAVPCEDLPKNMSCATLGYLLRGTSANWDFAALMLQWRAQGCLTIEPCGKEYIFGCLKKPVDAPQYEQNLFETMFAYGSGGYVTTVQLSGVLGAQFAQARRALLAEYRGKRALRFFGVVQMVVLTLGVVPVGLLGLLGMSAQGAGYLSALGFLAGILAQTCAAVLCLVVFGAGAGARSETRFAGKAVRGLCVCALAVWEILVAVLFVVSLPEMAAWVIAAVLILSTAACVLAAGFVCHGTEVRPELCNALGVAALVEGIDAERAALLRETEPDIGARLLPYACLLHAENAWCAAFASGESTQPSGDENAQMRAAHEAHDLVYALWLIAQ